MSMGAGDYFLEILRKSDDETLINFTLTVIGNVISSSEGNFFFIFLSPSIDIQFIAMQSIVIFSSLQCLPQSWFLQYAETIY